MDSYKAMVNDTIANALDTVQMKVVPFNSKWDDGDNALCEKCEERRGDISGTGIRLGND